MRKICIFSLALFNILLWFSKSNIALLVASRQPVLFNRYSVELFMVNVLCLFLSIVCVYVVCHDWKKRLVKACVYGFSFCLLLIALEFFLTPKRIITNSLMHYNANVYVKFTFHDRPRTQRTYPRLTKEQSVDVNFSTDRRGFRNSMAVDRADIVVVGDSCTEGIWVDDKAIWPYLLGKKINKTVYNLGVSGAHPVHYCGNFEKYGIPLKPKIAIFMLSELSDFGANKHHIPERFVPRLRYVVSHSKTCLLIRQLLVKSFGGINAKAPFANQEVFSWLPVEIQEPKPHRYAFYPSPFKLMMISSQKFKTSDFWQNTKQSLLKIMQLCRENDIPLIFVFIPSKTRAMFPFIKDKIPPKKFAQFLSLNRSRVRYQNALETIEKNIDTIEDTVRLFCKEQNVHFYSLLKELREYIEKHGKIYYTYDVHWSPEGHKVVGDILAKYLAEITFN